MADYENDPVLGIIGGSGLYDIPGLADTRWRRVASPFGEASDEILFGVLDGKAIAFLPRHGRGHRIPPTEVNYRANIDALKRSGVTDIVSVSAVGSFKEELEPGAFVIVDQFVDRTFARAETFFATGLVAHVSMAHPVCARLGDEIEAAAKEAGIAVVRGGAYLVIEGPQFSTLAESELYRKSGCDVIGMTNMPEARLAREAEICYATVAMVTDFDCWHPDHDHVTVAAIIETLHDNSDKAKALIGKLAPRLVARTDDCAQGCRRALDSAVITAPEARDPALIEKLDAIAGRVLNTKGP
ncbi:MAG: S-methyl-5'-thioadenosine phosphorylase [Proteobacteria bacterium]|nr:S-methyl-5'-thioadenosine phosphorylase [Pseudomonadota bacterium]